MQQKSSIGFLLNAVSDDSVFFEPRLLQQAKSITDSINVQLRKFRIHRVVMGGEDEQDEVVRIHRTRKFTKKKNFSNVYRPGTIYK